MAFEFLSCVTHGQATTAGEVLTTVLLQRESSILSRLASLGELAYLFEILLGAAAVVIGTIGVLRCFGRNALCSGPALIAEKCASLSDERRASAADASGADASGQETEVTIRLDEGHLWLLRRRRCIVTFQSPLGGTPIAGREVWYAKGEKSHS